MCVNVCMWDEINFFAIVIGPKDFQSEWRIQIKRSLRALTWHV